MGLLVGMPVGFGGAAPPTLTLTNRTIAQNDLASPWLAVAALKLGTDGYLYESKTLTGSYSWVAVNTGTDWKIPRSSTTPIYWKASATGDALDAGTVDNTWRLLEADQIWEQSNSVIFTSQTTTLTLSLGFDGSTTEESGTFTLQASTID